MTRKRKFRYLRDYTKEKKLKDAFMKRGVYGAIFDIPKKINRALVFAKNDNHRTYMIDIFRKLARRHESKKTLELLDSITS